MNITLRPKTEKLLEREMSRANCRDPDLLICAALEMLQEFEGIPIEELDPDTQAAIARAEAQSARGEGRQWPEVKRELQKRFLGT
jgi:hypothetical protein